MTTHRPAPSDRDEPLGARARGRPPVIEIAGDETDAELGAKAREALALGEAERAPGAEPEGASRLVEFVLRGPGGRGTRRREEAEGEAARAGGLTDALERARARGRARAAEVLRGPEMLSGEALGRLLGISRQAVDDRRRRGELLALDGPSRGLRYPAWQIAEDGHVVPGLAALLARLGGRPWAAYRFLMAERPDGSGRPFHTLLHEGRVEEALAHLGAIEDGAPT